MKLILAILFFSGAVLFWGWVYGPALLNDFNIHRNETTDARDMRIDEARCRSKLFIVSWCTISYSPVTSARRNIGGLEYFFIEHIGNQPVRLLRSTGDSSILTSDLGLTYFSSRIFALLLIGGLYAAGMVSAIIQLMRAMRREEETYPF
jgi:hypothetical protein